MPGVRGRSPEEVRLIRACESVLNWLKLGNVLLNGISYGSDDLLADPQASNELLGWIQKQHMSFYGNMPKFPPASMLMTYTAARKGNYQALRDGIPIKRENNNRPLFGLQDTGPVAVVYAYIGRNQSVHVDKRVLKIGYTSDDLGEYLRRLERQYHPELLGSRPGDKADEIAEHGKWRRHCIDGREWYAPVDEIFNSLRHSMKIVSNFDEIAARAKTGYFA
jgi:hypothetical protein